MTAFSQAVCIPVQHNASRCFEVLSVSYKRSGITEIM